MPPQTDNADHPSALPPSELNPLTNPILGQHMGRWAEVYFTNPPEKREQAVLELLHELEAESSPPEDAGAFPPAVLEHASAPRDSSAAQTLETPANLVECQSCGQENSVHYRFCGMCGARLAGEAAAADPPLGGGPQAELASSAQKRRPNSFASEGATDEPTPTPPAESWLAHNEREALPPNDYLSPDSDSAPAPNSYRGYVGVALAIVILALAYMAWRGMHAKSESVRLSPQVPSAVVRQSASSAPIPSPEKVPQPISAQPVSHGAVTKPSPRQATPAAPVMTTPAESGPLVPVRSGNGAEELALARGYLTGTNGQERNSAEAVDWLWKAVAKRNADATLLLSDLYLRGDTVPKNCDQARVLLDAAASRGMKDAAERLRNLQAFGCE